jgi:hypothetical protein
MAAVFVGLVSESQFYWPESITCVGRGAGQFITPDGNQVYPVRINGRTVYVTIPEE